VRPFCGGIHKSVQDLAPGGMYVMGHLGNREVEILVDSGANISLVNYDVFVRLEGPWKPQLRRYGVPMVTADGTPMKVYGCGEFALTLGEDTGIYRFEMCVADVGVDLIMGYDFLRAFCAVIDLGKDNLELMDGETPSVGKPEAQVPGRCNVVIDRTIVVPAGGEAVAQGQCVGVRTEFVGMLEPNEKPLRKNCMMVANAVVRAGPRGVPLRMFNAGDVPITLYCGTVAAQCVAVDVIQGVQPGLVEGKGVKKGRIPDHLKELYESGSQDLGEEDRVRLADLLCEYEEVFSAHSLDMGRTGLIKHKIDTAGAHPIKQRLRRVPLHMKGVVKEEVKKLSDRGLIEPSISPWASSLVLVKKKGAAEDGSPQ
jgi:hypothetical protein